MAASHRLDLGSLVRHVLVGDQVDEESGSTLLSIRHRRVRYCRCRWHFAQLAGTLPVATASAAKAVVVSLRM